MKVNSQFHVSANVLQVKGCGPGTHRTGGWVGCRVGLEVSERKTCWKSNHDCRCPVHSL